MQSGGAELGALQVAEALAREGHRALVVSEGGRMVPSLEEAGAEHLILPVASKNPVGVWRNGHALAEIARRENVDIIHARSRAPAWSCLLASRQCGVPFVTTYHSGYSEENRLKRLYNSVMVRGRRVIAVSNWISDIIINRYKVDPGRVEVIHRAVDPEVFDPDAIPAERITALRESWSIPDGHHIILVPARIARRKGQDDVVKALAKVRDQLPPFICVLAGDDQGKVAYRREVERLISELSMGDSIRMPGHVTDMPAAYASAAVSISAAQAPEGFQRGMLEAQAMACPVLVSDVGPGIEVVLSPPDYPVDEATGFNFAGRSPDALAEALLSVFRLAPDQRSAMGARGSHWVRSNYTRDRLTSKTMALYGDVVDEVRHEQRLLHHAGIARPALIADAAARPAVLQVVPRLDSGGAEQTTLDIAAAVADAGMRSLVASEGGRLTRAVEGVGATWIPFSAATKNPLGIMRNVSGLKAIMAENNVAVIHARSRAPAWSAHYAARQLKTPFVTTYHGAYSESHMAKRYYNSIMTRSDAVIANSRFTADLIRQRYGLDQQRLHVIHRGIDMARFDRRDVSAERVASLRAAWRIAPNDRVILLPGRLTGWKGQAVLIEAARRLYDTTDLRPKFILAGDAQGRLDYVRSLRTMITQIGLESDVRIVGHCGDMPAAYVLSDVAVIPSTEPEAFGRTAVEAQALECLTIVSTAGATRETVLAPPDVEKDRRTGWQFPVGDAVALADTITAVLTLSPDDATAMRTRARAHVACHFSLDAMTRDTLAIYEQLTGLPFGGRDQPRMADDPGVLDPLAGEPLTRVS
ncbi:MAG: glycosyltransferase family 4 protein [Pseudomonadota bacterium]